MRPEHGGARRPRLRPAAERRWLTRQDVIAEWPIAYSTLAEIPQSILPCARVGKSTLYDRADLEALFVRLKTTSLSEMIKDTAARPRRRRGRPPKRPVASGS